MNSDRQACSVCEELHDTICDSCGRVVCLACVDTRCDDANLCADCAAEWSAET